MLRVIRRRTPRWISVAASRVSARYPFLWRTRAFVYIGIGLFAALAAAESAGDLDVRRPTLPNFATLLESYPAWTAFLWIASALILWDVIRRVGPVFSMSNAFRVLGSVVISVFALSLFPYVYVNAALYRIAALESPSDLAALLQRNAGNKFWRCWSDRDQLAAAVLANRKTIESDLRRYGLEADFGSGEVPLEEDFYSGRACPYSMKIWALGHTQQEPSDVFHHRLSDIDAAQKYMKDGTGYFGEATSMVHVWMLGAVAIAFGAFAALFSYTALWRARLMAGVRPRLGMSRWRNAGVVIPWDAYLASRSPGLWVSNLHLTLPGLVSLLVLNSLGLTVTGISVAGVFLYGAIRAQAEARTLSTPISGEIRIAVIHAAFAVLVWGVRGVVQRDWNSDTSLSLVVYFLFFCSFLQAARSGSVASAVCGLLFLAITLVAWLIVFSVVLSVPIEGVSTLLSLLVVPLLGVLFVRATHRIEARPALRRLAITTCLISGPVPALWLLNFASQGGSKISSVHTILYGPMMMLASLAGIILALWLTADARRSVQFAAR